jgi:hypothetical protein
VQDCGEPVVRDTDPPRGWSWLSPEHADNRKKFGCPICLPADARIATPVREVPISRLAPGALVWSMGVDGRIARRVERVVSVAVPENHHLNVIELDDGRRLRASPGHPDAGGRAIGELVVGDMLDGARVRRVTQVSYRGHTFDLLLEEGGAAYFADGVLVRSTVCRGGRCASVEPRSTPSAQ